MNHNLPEVNLKLNVPQAMFAASRSKETYLEWGRGTGKSTVIAFRIKDAVYNMPRSKWGIVGETYTQLLTRTLPSTIEGLELLGFKKDLHYFVGKRPPSAWKWEEAYQPPLDYANYITFYNGTGFQLISLENHNSSRGLNLDGIIGDEAALLNIEKLSNNVLAANRGNMDRFKHTYLHHSVLFTTSTPVTSTGRWFLNQEELARQNPGTMFYLRAASTWNAHNLGADFFKSNKRKMPTLLYNAEILCERPKKVLDGFYPAFNENIHTYTATNENYLFSLNYNLDELKKDTSKRDSDVQINQPLDIANDWGAKINTMVVGQRAGNEYRILNALFLKSPYTLKELAQTFCEYYSNHIRKVVNFYYDHTANYRDAVRTITFADEFTNVLQNHGWTVNRIYVGQATGHNTKYLFMDNLLKESNPAIPKIRINANNCRYLIVSIQQAGVLEGKNGFEKDKRPERKIGVVDEETTHFSDAFDTLVYFKFKDLLDSEGYFI